MSVLAFVVCSLLLVSFPLALWLDFEQWFEPSQKGLK